MTGEVLTQSAVRTLWLEAQTLWGAFYPDLHITLTRVIVEKGVCGGVVPRDWSQ